MERRKTSLIANTSIKFQVKRNVQQRRKIPFIFFFIAITRLKHTQYTHTHIHTTLTTYTHTHIHTHNTNTQHTQHTHMHSYILTHTYKCTHTHTVILVSLHQEFKLFSEVYLLQCSALIDAGCKQRLRKFKCRKNGMCRSRVASYIYFFIMNH